MKVLPSRQNLALTLQQSTKELENLEENTHTSHVVFRPRVFRGQIGFVKQ